MFLVPNFPTSVSYKGSLLFTRNPTLISLPNQILRFDDQTRIVATQAGSQRQMSAVYRITDIASLQPINPLAALLDRLFSLWFLPVANSVYFFI